MTETMTAPRTVTITIPGTPAYALSPNARCHWGAKHRETNDAALAVRAALGDMYRYFPGPVRLHWTVYLGKGGKKRDPDNMLACLKAHTDALVRREVIMGDSPKYIPETPTVEQVTWSRHRGEPRIVVVITDAIAAERADTGGA